MRKRQWKWLIIIAAIAAAAVLVIVLAVANSPSNRVVKLLDLGQKYLEGGEYEEAVTAFEEVLTIDPKSVDAYLGEADAYVALGDYERAISVFEKGYEETADSRIKEKLDKLEQSAATSEEIDEKDAKPDDVIAEETAKGNTLDKKEENELYAGVIEAGNFVIWGKPFSEWTYDSLKEYIETNGTQDPSMAMGWHYNFDGGQAYTSDEGNIQYIGVTMNDSTYVEVFKEQFYGGQIQSRMENNYKSEATLLLGISLSEFLTQCGADELQNEIVQINDEGSIKTKEGEVKIIMAGDNLMNMSAEEITIHFYKTEGKEWVISSIGWNRY